MSEPRYVGLQRDSIPAIALEGGGELRLIAGEHGESTGSIETLTNVFMSTLSLPAGASNRLTVPGGRQIFLYVVDGEVSVGGESVRAQHLIELDRDGDGVDIETTTDARLLFGHADVIDEPVVSHGPFVMNTRDEIATAIDDYQAGRFGGLDQ
jgi:redox-sensitive bicupin YhaK (pirin superfamily)